MTYHSDYLAGRGFSWPKNVTWIKLKPNLKSPKLFHLFIHSIIDQHYQRLIVDEHLSRLPSVNNSTGAHFPRFFNSKLPT